MSLCPALPHNRAMDYDELLDQAIELAYTESDAPTDVQILELFERLVRAGVTVH